MKIKRFLIGLPVALLLLLLQSVLWVPGQKRQSIGNPARLASYYESTIGDAAILNPILSADTSSSRINGKVFDGLLDYDENLRHRGRLATSWTITEEAYLFPDERLTLANGSPATAANLHAAVEQARAAAAGASPLRSITAVSFQEAAEENRALPPELSEEKLNRITVKAPRRVKLTLKRVEQDLFRTLAPVLGAAYLERCDTGPFLKDVPAAKLKAIAHEVVPCTEHNPILTFELRPNVRFHDGESFTAADVAFTYEAILNEKNLSPRVSDYEPVKQLEIINPLRVRIVYKRLYSPAIGTWGMGILPKHLLDENGLEKEAKRRGLDPKTFGMRKSDFNRNPVGTGPFRFVRWKSDQYIELERNDAYWEGKPNYAKLVIRVLPEVLAEEMEFYAGTLDGYVPRPYQVERYRKHPDTQIFSGLSYSYDYIGYNLRREPFKDVRVRRALALAINLDDMIRYLYYGHAEQTTGPFLKQTPYYDQTVPPLPYDPKAALALLAEAGYERNGQGAMIHQATGKPLAFTLISNNGNDIRKGIMTIAQQSWAKIGIHVSIEEVEWTVFLQKHINALDFDAVVLGWSMGIDPDLYQIWHSSQAGPQQLNFVGYSNPKADELIVRIRQEYDPDKLVQICHELHRIIYEDQPYTFLVASRWTALLDRNIVRRIQTPEGIKELPVIPTKSGDYDYHFNQWIKVEQPAFAAESERPHP